MKNHDYEHGPELNAALIKALFDLTTSKGEILLGNNRSFRHQGRAVSICSNTDTKAIIVSSLGVMLIPDCNNTFTLEGTSITWDKNISVGKIMEILEEQGFLPIAKVENPKKRWFHIFSHFRREKKLKVFF